MANEESIGSRIARGFIALSTKAAQALRGKGEGKSKGRGRGKGAPQAPESPREDTGLPRGFVLDADGVIAAPYWAWDAVRRIDETADVRPEDVECEVGVAIKGGLEILVVRLKAGNTLGFSRGYYRFVVASAPKDLAQIVVGPAGFGR